MKIRLHGTVEECRQVAERLPGVVEVLAVSEPYPDRGASVLVRVYVEARIAPPVHVNQYDRAAAAGPAPGAPAGRCPVMTWNDHNHRGEYAEDGHDHHLDYAEKHHRHHDDESTVRGLREDLSRAEERIRELHDDLRDALNRIHALEDQTPQARQLQLEADQAAADLAESGYGDERPAPVAADRHGRECKCPFCYYDEPDERGVSEYHREELALEHPEEPW